MSSEDYRDIVAFLAVAQERSFTRAAARLGVSPSAVSHTVRALETRLGLRLLTRTTRSVAPTEAGQRLVESVGPRFDVITEELESFSELRDRPAGVVRITTSDFAYKMVLWPKLSELQPKYPDIKFDISIDAGLVDIVAERYDAGIRFGDQIAKDMKSVRISPDISMAVVGAPSYLKKHPAPTSPTDLSNHACINMRFSGQAGVYAWELKKGKRNLRVRVDGPWTFNSATPVVEAAEAGFGLAYLPEYLVRSQISRGRLIAVLPEWCPTFPGLHIFFASRRQSAPALSVVIDALRYSA